MRNYGRGGAMPEDKPYAQIAKERIEYKEMGKKLLDALDRAAEQLGEDGYEHYRPLIAEAKELGL